MIIIVAIDAVVGRQIIGRAVLEPVGRVKLEHPVGGIGEKFQGGPLVKISFQTRNHHAIGHVPVIEVQLARVRRGIRAELREQAVERVTVVGGEAVAGGGKPVGEPGGSLVRIKKFLRGEEMIRVVRARPRQVWIINKIVGVRIQRGLQRPIAVTVNLVVLKRHDTARTVKILHAGQRIVIVTVAITQKGQSVFKGDTLIGRTRLIIGIEAIGGRKSWEPLVGVQIRQKCRQIDFPSANALIAQITVGNEGR